MLRGVGDVPLHIVPPSVHVAVFPGDADSVVLRALGQFAPDFLELGDGFWQRLAFDRTGESADQVAIKQTTRIETSGEIIDRAAL